ncbi:ArsR/SmtB family transcription factor [Inquilinus sp. OTU3971]|uniref:ArsR/SmtB family transcription factor n=1 Tax=Inquilinus sp. OTU3971 TaxID=3043855 RepID=UPI00313CFD9C
MTNVEFAFTVVDLPLNFDNVRNMEIKPAVDAFSALGHETRLAAFRLLVEVGPSGLPAGEIAERLGVVASTLSFHLAQLERAQLLRSWRVQRQIFYGLDIEGTRQLIGFLVADCCGGNPSLCGDLATVAEKACC